MSHSNFVQEAGGGISHPSYGDGGSEEETQLAPEMKDALITRAKNIIAGRVQPSPLVASPEIEQVLQREFKECEQPPTAEALRRVVERSYLESHYGGKPVAYFTTQAGALAVLASGDREIEVLLWGLSNEEGEKVVVTDSEQF